MDLDDLLKMRKEAERRRTERDRAQGALKPLRDQAKAEYGASSAEDLKALARKKAKEADKAEAEAERLTAEYRRKYEGKK